MKPIHARQSVDPTKVRIVSPLKDRVLSNSHPMGKEPINPTPIRIDPSCPPCVSFMPHGPTNWEIIVSTAENDPYPMLNANVRTAKSRFLSALAQETKKLRRFDDRDAEEASDDTLEAVRLGGCHFGKRKKMEKLDIGSPATLRMEI